MNHCYSLKATFFLYSYLRCGFTSLVLAVVKIMFNNETYNFTEGESGQIEVRISLTVAQDVRVTVNGGINECVH